MARGLTSQAERFLRRLEDSLVSLPASQREDIVRQYRERLSLHAVYGFQSLRAAIEELGSVEDVAKAHLAAAAERESSRISSCTALVLMPEHRNLPAISSFIPWPTTRQDLRATFAASREDLIPIAGAVFAGVTGLTILSSYAGLVQDRLLGAIAGGLLLPVFLSVCLVAALRAMLAREGSVWTLDRGLLIMAGLAAGAGVTGIAAGAILPIVIAAFEADAFLAPWLAAASAGLLAGAAAWASVPSLPWLVALATDREAFSHGQSRSRMARRRRAWVAASAASLLPLLALHLVLREAPLFFPVFGGPHLALAGLDGIVLAALLLRGSALLAVAFRWTAGEAIPEPLPFTLRKPASDQVRFARRRMERLAESDSPIGKRARFGPAPPLARGG